MKGRKESHQRDDMERQVLRTVQRGRYIDGSGQRGLVRQGGALELELLREITAVAWHSRTKACLSSGRPEFKSWLCLSLAVACEGKLPNFSAPTLQFYFYELNILNWASQPTLAFYCNRWPACWIVIERARLCWSRPGSAGLVLSSSLRT